MSKKTKNTYTEIPPFIDPAAGKKTAHVIPDLGDVTSVVPALKMQLSALPQSVIYNNFGSVGRAEELLRLYMQRLTDDRLMLKLSAIKKMDILDVTSFAELPEDGYTVPRIPDTNREEREAIKRLGWYAIVPCFEHAAVKLNKFRYIVFDVLEVDPEEKSVIVRIYDYMRIKGTWQTGVATTVKAKDFDTFDKPEGDGLPAKHYLVLEHTDDLDFEGLYTLYSRKELGWSEGQWKLWNDVIVANSREVARKLREEHDTCQCDQLANLFMKVIARCNAMLEMNKPSRPVRKDGAPKGTRKVGYEEGSAPERKVRNVGTLRVQSKGIPRKPCLETVITYKVAKWTVRGHVRHYASGKQAYIKPGVRRRKALENTEETTATTIRFRKKKQTGE